ncbi:MAG: glycosyl hydrolase family 28-related protein [Ginsengibacter sp.]
MLKIFLLTILTFALLPAIAQVQTQVIGDSIYIHSNNSTGELILQNSTDTVNGFLFNRGAGRTEFRHALTRISDSSYLVGNDTLVIKSNPSSTTDASAPAGPYLYFDSTKTLNVNVSNDPDPAGDSSKLITDWAAKNYADKYAKGTLDTVATIQDLENYNLFRKVVVVGDTLRGGIFHWVNTAKPDSGTVFPSASGGYWKRSWDYMRAPITWFGAIPDGITDNRAAIQEAIDYFDTNKGGRGGTVYIPAGTWIVSPTVYLGFEVNLEGTWGSVLKLASNSTGNMFQNSLIGNTGYCFIRGLQIYGADQKATAFGIVTNGHRTSDVYWDNLLINHWGNDAINITNGWQLHLNNSVVEFIGGSCIRMTPTGVTAETDIRRFFISNNGLYKSQMDSTSAVIDMNGSMANKWILGVYMNNNKIENTPSFQPAIRINGVAGVEIAGNWIVSYPDNSMKNLVNVISIDSSALGSISSNTIASWLEYGAGQIASWNKARYGIYVTDSSFNWTYSANTYWHINSDTIHVDPSCYNISFPIVSDSLRNNGGVLEMRKNGVFVPQLTLPVNGTGTVSSFSKTDGYGIISSVTNASTTPNYNAKVDTTVIASKSYTAGYLPLTGGMLSGTVSMGKTFNSYGGYGNVLDLSGGITMKRTREASYLYLSAGFDTANNIIGSVAIFGNEHNLRLTTNNTTDGNIVFSPASGRVISVTPSTSDNSSNVATTAFVKNQNYLKSTGGTITGDIVPGVNFTNNLGSFSNAFATVFGYNIKSPNNVGLFGNAVTFGSPGGTITGTFNSSTGDLNINGRLMSVINSGNTGDSLVTSHQGILQKVSSSTYAISSTTPIISTGTTAPTSTPAKAGDIYIDLTNRKLYFAGGNSSSSDWIIAN